MIIIAFDSKHFTAPKKKNGLVKQKIVYPNWSKHFISSFFAKLFYFFLFADSPTTH